MLDTPEVDDMIALYPTDATIKVSKADDIIELTLCSVLGTVQLSEPLNTWLGLVQQDATLFDN